MSRRSTRLFKAALSALYYSGADSLLAPLTRGDGVILTLHHVSPTPPDPFEPNRILRVTPEFLDGVIEQTLAAGFDVVSLDEAHRRITSQTTARRPFVCFTFDDGYRDNRDYAYPIFKRRGLPFAIYVPTDFADGHGELWWLALEEVVRRSRAVCVQMNGGLREFPCTTVAEKYAAFHEIYWWLRSIPEDRARRVVAELADAVGIDQRRLCTDRVMTWDEIRALASDPLVTIGAHTRRHFALAKLPFGEARTEIVESVGRIERELCRPCHHFSFPYGDEGSAGPREFTLAAELGLKTAVTTRKGVITGNAERTGLPRVSLNGDYQDLRYVKVMLSGAPFAVWNLFRGRAREGSSAA